MNCRICAQVHPHCVDFESPCAFPRLSSSETPQKQKAGSVLKYTLIVRAPPNGNVAPASIYWLHVLDQGGYKANNMWQPGHWVPNVKGMPVRLWRKKFAVSPSVALSRISAV